VAAFLFVIPAGRAPRKCSLLAGVEANLLSLPLLVFRRHPEPYRGGLAKDPCIVTTATTAVVFAVVFAVAVVSEIGPGFSPDIKGHYRMGFSP